MRKKIYAVEKYRIVERENKLGEKFYFLQYCWFGFNLFKFSFMKMRYNKQPIKSEFAWMYVFRSESAVEPFLIKPTMDFSGETISVDLNEHVGLACKSKEDATILMHEYAEYLKKSRKEKSDKKIEDEARKKEQELKKLTLKENVLEVFNVRGEEI